MGESALHIAKPGSSPDLTEARESILKTLSYFAIFYYPLTPMEIRQFLGRNTSSKTFCAAIEQLQQEEKIYYLNGFYALENNSLLALRRTEGNQRAAQLLRKAARIGRFLYYFPFTRAIGISGSLSKNYADEKADIDFFIITRADRLWIARTLMHLYKKLTYITGRQHYHCMNYYIDEKALLLTDQNIYTAIEIKTLLPVVGEPTMKRFFESNQWADEWLPACAYRSQDRKDRTGSWFKKAIEWLLGGKVFDHIDNYLLGLTRSRWKRKEEKGKQNGKGLRVGLITGKHFARSNPGDFQERVLAIYDQKLSALKDPLYQPTLSLSSVK